MLQTTDLTIRFGGHVAVNAVSCRFEPGTLTAIVGPNGAGKTTYFNLISGQLKASAGTVSLNGRELSGLSASALHGSKWIGADEPAELNQPSLHGEAKIVLHSDELGDDEICLARGIRATTPARTAFDLGRRKGQTLAVIRVDALLQATQLKLHDVQALIDTHGGARGLVQLRRVVDLVDYGSESPQETRLRLLFTKSGMRPTHTQIEVFDGRYQVGRIDMGWPEWKVGVQYDGIQHWDDPRQRTRDIDQDVEYRDLGWRMVRVGADLLRNRQPVIIARIRAELHAAGAGY